MATVTKHAKSRMHIRIGITKGIADKYAARVLREGIKHEDTLGDLHKWMDAEFLKYRTANNMRYYSGKLYIFNGTVLITVLNDTIGFETSLFEYVDKKAYRAYSNRRITKRYKQLAEQENDRKTKREDEILQQVREYVKENYPDIEITNIAFAKKHVVRVNYVSESTYNDWNRYTGIMDFIKLTFALGSYLRKVKDADGRFVSLEEWRNMKGG